MKATNKQNNIINLISSIVSYWKTTNDINSLSHCSIIEDEVMSLEDIDEDIKEELSDKLIDVWYIIRKFK